MSTKIKDVIVPEVFNPYVIKRTMELSALISCGIVRNSKELDVLATKGGKLINMPFWNDLTGEDEVLTDDTALTVQGISSGKDVAALLMRGNAWGVNDLASALSGSDPMSAVGDLIASYWSRKQQATLISILKGMFLASNMSSKVLDISKLSGDLSKINGSTFLDATQLMGDAKDRLTGVMMHSTTETQLRKNNLIQVIFDSENKPIKYFQEKRVIVDDGCPVENIYLESKDTTVIVGKTYYVKSGDKYIKVDSPAGNPSTSAYYEIGDKCYTTYLFGEGAIGLGNGKAPVPTETDRDSLAGEDILINRNHFLLHPRGVAFQSASVAKETPSNAELALGTNWSKVYDDKNIRIVQFKHKL